MERSYHRFQSRSSPSKAIPNVLVEFGTAWAERHPQKFIVVDIVYSPSILMAKLSLLFLYLEIFRPNIKLRYFIYFGMVFVTLFYTATMIGFFYYTMPRPGQSLLTAIAGGNTEKDIGLSIVQASVNVASDFYILSLPIVGVWKLQLSPKKRVGVTAIFMTGLL